MSEIFSKNKSYQANQRRTSIIVLGTFGKILAEKPFYTFLRGRFAALFRIIFHLYAIENLQLTTHNPL